MALILVLIFTYIFVTFFGFVVHRALHQKWAGRFNISHMNHHLKLYPTSDFTSDIYRKPGKNNTARMFAIASIPVALIPVVLYFIGVFALPLMIVCIVEMLILGFLHDFFHDSFHINNHWFGKLPVLGTWFKKLVKLHFIHHVDMQKNLGIFVFHWDRIFSTYVEK